MALFQPGQSGNPAGKPKGAISKYKHLLAKLYENFNPLEKIKELAETTHDEDLQFQCYKELSRYFAPQLKAIELSSGPEAPVKFEINITNDLDKI